MAAPVLLAASAATLALEPISASAAVRSHTHHSAVRPLPASSFVETSTRSTPRHKNSSAHAGSHSHVSSHVQTRTSSRGSRSHQHQAPAVAAPMNRASRANGRHKPYTAANEPTIQTIHTHHGRHAADTMVAEVSGRSGNAFVAHIHAKGHARYTHSFEASNSVVVVAPISHNSAAGHGSALTTDDFVQAAGEPNTQGISHPERLQGNNSAIIGTAEAIAAPDAPVTRTPQPQIVSGFGGEVAVANATGGTHRRNHPVPASALPDQPAPPVSLADREAVIDSAVRPSVLPEIYDHSGRLMMPAPLKGSHDVLVHQNTMAMTDGLERIQDDRELDRLRADHELVSFATSDRLRLNEDLPANRRYARPWTVLFAQDIARDFFARFRQPLQVNSAVRTVGYQLRLQRVNGNAAAVDGDGASPHLTGQAIDLGKRGMSAAQIAWMRAYLLPLMQAGKIDVEEEFQQACFHISVYRHYASGRRIVHEVAQLNTVPTHTTAIPAAPADDTNQ